VTSIEPAITIMEESPVFVPFKEQVWQVIVESGIGTGIKGSEK